MSVDPKTGHVAVLDYLAVEDVGRIINPLTLHGQTVGAVVQGLGGALLEHIIYDENGQLLTGSLADYLMPSASDFPQIRAMAFEERPAPHNPLGAKGAGEGGIIPVGGVIANAVADALAPFGVEPRDLPLSPPRRVAVDCRSQGARRITLTGSRRRCYDNSNIPLPACRSECVSHENAALRVCLPGHRCRSRATARLAMTMPSRLPAARA